MDKLYSAIEDYIRHNQPVTSTIRTSLSDIAIAELLQVAERAVAERGPPAIRVMFDVHKRLPPIWMHDMNVWAREGVREAVVIVGAEWLADHGLKMDAPGEQAPGAQ